MKHTALIIILGVSALTTACSHKAKENESTIPTVDVAVAGTDSVTLFKTYPGTIHAASDAAVMCRVNGMLTTIDFDGGAIVRKGQLLFTIDPSTYRNALAEAQAAVAEAESNNRYAEAHYTAVERASASNAVSQMEVAQALSNRDTSRAALSNARAALQQARDNLALCYIRAPFDGRISSSKFADGNYIAGEGSPVELAHIYADQKVDAYFSIEDASFLRMFTNPNNRHLINYDSIPVKFTEPLPHKHYGRLFYLAPNVDTSTGAMQLKCNIDNRWGELREGMFASVDLPYKVDPQAVVVRDASIGTDQLGKYIYVVNDSNRVVYTPITVGALANDTMRIVEKGLAPGARYVVSAMLKVRDGMPVNPRVTTPKH